jgi:pSer/pThr/pTyr-binding forkhead associated (FHA) protein
MRLLGRTGKLRGQTHAVSGTTRIGRGPENELLVMVEGVSRRHARIVPDDTGFWLEDLGSANGTRLNGQPVKRERLEHLDVITLGPGADLIVDARRSETKELTSRLPRPATIHLDALDGPQEGTSMDVRPGEISIGRVAPANLIIENPAVSKMHARLRRNVNTVVLEDFQSANGTYVNGARVSEPVTLKHGDHVSIAGLRTFKITIAGAPPEAATPAPAPAPVASAAAGDTARAPAAFDQEWRTKLVWSPDELAALDVARALALGDTGPRPVVPTPTTPRPAAAGAARVPPAEAPRTQHFDSLPLPPPVAPPSSAPPPRAAAPPEPAAPRTQHFDSLPLPPPVPPSGAAPPASKPAPRAAVPAEPAAPRTQHFDSLPLPPPLPGGSPAAAPSPAAAEPRTQHFDSLPEPPPAFGAPAPSPPPAPTTPRAAPRPSEVPTQQFDAVRGIPMPATPQARQVRGLRLRGASQEFVLKEGRHQVGRQETCDVPVLDRQVSRAHAVLTVTGEGVTVEDQKSANGTFVNGQRLSAVTPLRHGDRVTFGGAEFGVELLDQI